MIRAPILTHAPFDFRFHGPRWNPNQNHPQIGWFALAL